MAGRFAEGGGGGRSAEGGRGGETGAESEGGGGLGTHWKPLKDVKTRTKGDQVQWLGEALRAVGVDEALRAVGAVGRWRLENPNQRRPGGQWQRPEPTMAEE